MGSLSSRRKMSMPATSQRWLCTFSFFLLAAWTLLRQCLSRWRRKNTAAPARARQEWSPAQVVVVTGAGHGIGRQICAQLLQQNVRVLALCAPGTHTAPAGVHRVYHCDHRELQDVRRCARSLAAHESHIHAVMLVAGVLCPRRGRSDSKEEDDDGKLDETMRINFLSPLLLANLLLPAVQRAKGSVIYVSSEMHALGGPGDFWLRHCAWPFHARLWRRLGAHAAYAASKLAMHACLFALAASCRRSSPPLCSSCVRVAAVHPGVVSTAFYRHQPLLVRALLTPLRRLMLDARASASTVIHIVERFGENAPLAMYAHVFSEDVWTISELIPRRWEPGDAYRLMALAHSALSPYMTAPDAAR